MSGQPTLSRIFAKRDDVSWRDADGILYLIAPDRGKAFKIEGLSLIPVSGEELKRIFGGSDTNVIRISNQI